MNHKNEIAIKKSLLYVLIFIMAVFAPMQYVAATETAESAQNNVRHLKYSRIVADPVQIENKTYGVTADVSYYSQILYSKKKVKADRDLMAIVSSDSLDTLARKLSGAKDVTGLLKWKYKAKNNKKCSDKAYFIVKASVNGKVARSIGLKGDALKSFKKGVKNLNKSAKAAKLYFTITTTLDADGTDDGIAPVRPVQINSSAFPDDAFRKVISGRDYDGNQNGILDEDEISKILNIYCEGKGIKSIKGIEYFVALQGLWCKNNEISEMDLSNNRDLRGVSCSGNKFTALDFSYNTRLEWVYCFDCKLKSLNVSNNPKLAYLECNTNPLTSLDLTHNPELEHLTCGTCELTELDLSQCHKLSHLDAFSNKLTSIDLSDNPRMKRLNIWNNTGLGNVDISTLEDLEYYNCASNGVTGTLDMRKHPHLQMLNCAWNKGVTHLDLSGNPELAWLRCGSCSLGKLDISHNPKLYFFEAFDNNFDVVVISNNHRLIYTMEHGEYKEEPEVGGWSCTVRHGGSHEEFDELDYTICMSNNAVLNSSAGAPDVPDSYLNTDDGLSSSGDFLTREQAMVKLYELAKKPAVSGESGFTDVEPGSPYEAAITWGKQNYICFGYPNICSDTFGVGELVTREDMALMLHRYAEYAGYNSAFDYGKTDNFADFFDIDFYAWGAFTWAIQWKILPTRGDHLYPHGRVTSQELSSAIDTLIRIN